VTLVLLLSNGLEGLRYQSRTPVLLPWSVFPTERGFE
jgi:hypothetical protein